MPTPERLPAPQPGPAHAAFEARIAWLEAAVTQLLGEQARRALPQAVVHTALQPGIHLNLVDGPAGNPAAAVARHPTAPLSTRLSLATTQPLSRLVQITGFAGVAPEHPPPQGKPAAINPDCDDAAASMSLALNGMGITAAFASLDAKVEEASAAECMIAPIRLSRAPVLDIDAGLIDAALHDASSKQLNERASIESQYPSITLKVCSAWRTPELRVYLQRLLADDHGKRGGLDPHARGELQFLSAVLDAEPPVERRTAAFAGRH